MRKVILYILLSLTPMLLSGQFKGGYEIGISIPGLADSTVYLAYHLGDKQYIQDTIKLDKSGHGTDAGKETLPQGIYMIVLPGRKYFELLVSSNQRFSVSCTYNDYFNTLKFTGSDENSAFVDYQKNWVLMQQRAMAISKRIQNNRQNKLEGEFRARRRKDQSK